MKVIYGLTHFKSSRKKSAVALGIFDGLHRGHFRIIARLIREANRLNTRSVLVTFFPHPQKQKTLYSLSHRLNLLKDLGIDLCLVINFTPILRRISAEEFLENILIKKINPAIVIVGKNFTFGRQARGDWQMLKKYSTEAKFEFVSVNVLTYRGRAISSTWIRNLIKAGKFPQAEKLLGRPVTIFGKVTRGYSFARRLGYPTANIDPDHEILPPFGVYAVRIRLAKKLYPGICYIGNSPTLERIKRKSEIKVKALGRRNIEVHIFDFKGNLYGRKLNIEFVKMIRPQKTFHSIQALSLQIKKDVCSCLNIKAAEKI